MLQTPEKDWVPLGTGGFTDSVLVMPVFVGIVTDDVSLVVSVMNVLWLSIQTCAHLLRHAAEVLCLDLSAD